MAYIFQDTEVTNGYVSLKFVDTVKLSSIVSSAFVLVKSDATAVEIANPFKDFSVASNYNTISRTLRLYWEDGVLEPETSYILTVTGLLDAASRTIDDGTVEFETSTDTDPDAGEIEPPEPTPVEIVDYSIVTNLDFSETDTIDPDALFEVISSDPVDGEFFIDNDYNLGRITITFNKRPSVEKVNSTYFKVYRKLVQRAPIKWESITPRLTLSGSSPVVYVDFPSLDDGSFYTADKEYFEDGYKYKVTVVQGLSD